MKIGPETRRLPLPRRSGATAVEVAIVAPVALLLLIGLLVGALGVFHYQQVTYLAEEASRWASLHGAEYASTTGHAAAAPDDGIWSGGSGQCTLLYNTIIVPNATTLALSRLKYTVSWNKNNSQYYSKTVNGQTVHVANSVTVTVTYSWLPELLLGGQPITLSGTSTSTMVF